MDQLILLPSVLLHKDNRLVQDDLAALSWPGCTRSANSRNNHSTRGSSFCGTRVTFTGNGTFYVCVKNDGMSDQPKQNLQNRSSVGVAASSTAGGVGGANNNNNNGANNERPGSARSNRERHERVILLKERQNSERIKKLEELKEQALAAAKLREEQDSKRRKHFEELGKRDDERRRQAEERRRMLEEERKMTLQAKWETKKNSVMSASMNSGRPSSSKPTYAFGSCTPRLLDNHVDGFLWKSQYNLNIMKEPGLRASSAHDLHLQNESSSSGMDTPTRVFCGRRKTDLTPTIPIKRDDYSSAMMSRSTSRGSGRVYSSMTRLDRSRSPGGITQYQHHHPHGSSNPHLSQPQRPSRSKSTTHLQSTGLKLTRTEILRQALANKKDQAAGIRSVDASRPPSSMSSSIMTSSTHSQVQMRPRTSYVRKARPASVHVTGVSNEHAMSQSEILSSAHTKDHTPLSSRRSETPASVKSSVSRKTSNEIKQQRQAAVAAAASGKSSGKTSPSPMMMMETSTIKRNSSAKKKLSPSLSSSSSSGGGGKAKTPEPTNNTKVKSPEPSKDVVVVPQDNNTVQNNAPEPDSKKVNDEQQILLQQTKSEKNNADNFESIESAFASGSEDFNTYSSKTPEPFARAASSDSANNTVSELLESAGRDSASTNATIEDGNAQQWSNPFNENVTPEPTKESLLKPEGQEDDQQVMSSSTNNNNSNNKGGNSPLPPSADGGNNEDDGGETQKPKIMTEEEAKAALAEKRRLAREAAEREAARIAELERLELERQRLEEEEAERMAMEARRLEEERLRKAIEEEQKRQEDEKKRKEEEEKARVEKERQERAAAKEAERIRLEMEERLRREEAERLERKRRVEAIMSRTRKKEAEQQQQQQQAKANITNSNNATSEIVSQQNDLNGHKENIINQENIMQSTVNSLNNNFNNNNDFSGTMNNDLIDNNSSSGNTNTASGETLSGNSNTLISFDGMNAQQQEQLGGAGAGSGVGTSTSQLIMDNAVAVDLLNFSQQQNQQMMSDSNISPDLLGSTNASPTPALVVGNSLSNTGASPNNSIISNPLQEVFIIDLLS